MMSKCALCISGKRGSTLHQTALFRARTLTYLIEIQPAHPMHIVDAFPKWKICDRRVGDKNGKNQQN